MGGTLTFFLSHCYCFPDGYVANASVNSLYLCWLLSSCVSIAGYSSWYSASSTEFRFIDNESNGYTRNGKEASETSFQSTNEERTIRNAQFFTHKRFSSDEA